MLRLASPADIRYGPRVLPIALRLVVSAVLAAKLPKPEPEPEYHLIWEWIEEHGWFAYPALAVLVIGLIAAAMVSSARSEEVTAEHRGKLKMEIMGIMRRRVSGVTAENVSTELSIGLMLASQLLTEMTQEGLITPMVVPGSVQQYRLRGRT